VKGYEALVKDTDIDIFGTIGDHDYGTNSGDKIFAWGKQNGTKFVHFLGLDPSTSAMAGWHVEPWKERECTEFKCTTLPEHHGTVSSCRM
jgi:hypothetical protein